MRLFSEFETVVCGQVSTHAIDECVTCVSFGINAGTGIIGAIVVGSYLLPDKLTVPQYRSFPEIVLQPDLLEDSNVAVRRSLWFQDDGVLARCGQAVRQWLNASYPILQLRSYLGLII